MPTNFLQETGFLTAPFNLMTTELNALGSGANGISSVGGTAGVFTQTNFGSGIYGAVHFKAGGAFTGGGRRLFRRLVSVLAGR